MVPGTLVCGERLPQIQSQGRPQAQARALDAGDLMLKQEDDHAENHAE